MTFLTFRMRLTISVFFTWGTKRIIVKINVNAAEVMALEFIAESFLLNFRAPLINPCNVALGYAR